MGDMIPIHIYLGYYAQLNTIPEVKEHVLNYIHVLARPLVLKKSRKIAWTSLYAHQVVSTIYLHQGGSIKNHILNFDQIW